MGYLQPSSHRLTDMASQPTHLTGAELIKQLNDCLALTNRHPLKKETLSLFELADGAKTTCVHLDNSDDKLKYCLYMPDVDFSKHPECVKAKSVDLFPYFKIGDLKSMCDAILFIDYPEEKQLVVCLIELKSNSGCREITKDDSHLIFQKPTERDPYKWVRQVRRGRVLSDYLISSILNLNNKTFDIEIKYIGIVFRESKSMNDPRELLQKPHRSTIKLDKVLFLPPITAVKDKTTESLAGLCAQAKKQT